jgi:hypothetical protein
MYCDIEFTKLQNYFVLQMISASFLIAFLGHFVTR